MAKNKTFAFFLHVLCWIFITFPAVISAPQHARHDTLLYVLRLVLPVSMCMVFYLNYLWLVPHYFINRKMKWYFGINVIVVFVFSLFLQEVQDIIHQREFAMGFDGPPHFFRHRDELFPISAFFLRSLRNLFPLGISVLVANLMSLAFKWYKAEEARKEMEMQKTEAELRNLRSQINPHFLLNTLNNIYSLIAFDQDKAQKAVLSLSELLRQMLYRNQDSSISLKEEADFLCNYIDLMRIRVSKDVRIDVNISLPPVSVRIAPFILISLVENAFKHGISKVHPSFISVNIKSGGKKIVCEIQNSNFPKSDSDRSGHGIGLEQVAKRLELSYKDKYEWVRGVDEKTNVYTSKIIIYDTQLCNNR